MREAISFQGDDKSCRQTSRWFQGVIFMVQDDRLIAISTLVLTIMTLVSNFVIEILYGIINPRIKADQPI